MQVNRVQGDSRFGKYRNSNSPRFTAIIPKKQIFTLGTTYEQRVINEINPDSIYNEGRAYYDSVVALVKKDSSNSKENNFFRLFRHDIGNAIAAAIELKLNPLYNEEQPLVKFIRNQKRSFKSIVNAMNEMALYWDKLDTWDTASNIKVSFDEVFKQLLLAVDINKKHMSSKPRVIVENSIDTNSSTQSPFELYSLLSNVLLNGVKYSEGKDVHVHFSTNEVGKNFMTVFNEHTKNLSNFDIDEIMKGTGYRSKENYIHGTGTGMAEVVKILMKNNEDLSKVIEKDRTEGVRITIPFNLDKN